MRKSAPIFRLDELAARFALERHGAADITIHGVATLAGASRDQLTFLANPSYANQLKATQAGAVVLTAEQSRHSPVATLVANDPYATFAKIAALFESQAIAQPGIHPSAVVDSTASIDPSASIGPGCVIEQGVQIERGAVIGPRSVIGPDCHIGAQSHLLANVTLVTRVHLGQRVLIHPGAVLGADGFGLAFSEGHWLKIPQLGGVKVGDDCEIGANTTIDRGSLDDTTLEEDVRLDNQIQIAHNVVIGAHTAMAGCSAIAGSTRIGKYCRVGGGAGILGHLEVGDRVTITAMSLVTSSIKNPGEYSSGTPLQSKRLWRRNAVRLKHLDELTRRVATLEKEKTRHE